MADNKRSRGLKTKKNIYSWVYLIFTLILYGIFITCEILFDNDTPDFSGSCEEFVADWVRVCEDGRTEPIQIPGRYEVAKGEESTIQTILPESIKKSVYICFPSVKKDVRVYVGDELRAEYTTQEQRYWGNSSPTQYIFVDVEPDDIGKTFTIISKTESAYTGIFYKMYIGDSFSIWFSIIKSNFLELLVGFVALVLGILSIVVGIVVRNYYKKETELYYLGFVVIFSATWLVCNSSVRQLIFKNVSFANDMAFVMIMTIPLVLSVYINMIQQKRHNKVFNVIQAVCLSNMIICVTLHLLNIVDYGTSFFLMVSVIGFSLCCIFYMFYKDVAAGKVKEYKFSFIGIIGIALACVLQILLYLRRVIEFSGIVLMTGLLFLLIISLFKGIADIWYTESDRQRAIAAGEARGRFLANMSHEIRTPINAIIGLNEMVLRESNEEEIKEYAMKIGNSSVMLLELVNDILDFSKIDSGKMELMETEYDMAEVINTLIVMVKGRAESKGLDFRVNIAPELPSRLYGDETRIKQIMANLLTNAVKYTANGYIDFSVSVVSKDEYLTMRVEVKDSGIGIKENDLEKLFLEFERVDEISNKGIEGTGLGLSISKRLLEMMGSTLSVESTYGEGSTFFFELKQKIVDDKEIGDINEIIKENASNYIYRESFTAEQAKILAVDDTEINLDVLRNLLKQTKAQITLVSSGRACLEAVMKDEYDIVFLDHMMPEMNGIDTLHELRKLDVSWAKNMPVIALTANAISGAKEMYISEGFSSYLSKPIDYKKLEELLIQYLPPEKVALTKERVEADGLDNENIAMDIPDIEGIDLEYAKIHFKNTPDLVEAFSAMVRLLENSADNISILAENIRAEGKLDEYRIAVHTIKSSGALIGAVAISGMAQMLEKVAKEADYDAIKCMTPYLVSQMMRLKEKLSECFGGKYGGTRDLDVNAVNALFDTLKAASDKLDIDTMDEVMTELSQYRYDAELGGLMDKLAYGVDNLDNELIDDVISKIKNMIK